MGQTRVIHKHVHGLGINLVAQTLHIIRATQIGLDRSHRHAVGVPQTRRQLIETRNASGDYE
jgi:hypothetical protein